MFRPEDLRDLARDEREHPEETQQLLQHYELSPDDQRSLLRIRTRLLRQSVSDLPTETHMETVQMPPVMNEAGRPPLAGQFLPPSSVPLPARRKRAPRPWQLVALIAVICMVILSGVWYTLAYTSTSNKRPVSPRVTPTTAPVQNVPSFEIASFKMTSAHVGWAIGSLVNSDGTITFRVAARTADGGKTWHTFNLHDEPAGFFSTFFLNDQVAWVGVGSGTGPESTTPVMHTTDGGQHWTLLQAPSLTDNLTFVDPQHGWAWSLQPLPSAPKSMLLYQTSDGGQTWRQVSTIDAARSFESTALGPLPLGDGGLSLTFLTLTHGWATIYLSQTSQRVYLYQTWNGGATWQLQQWPQPASGPIPGVHTTLPGGNTQSGAFVSLNGPTFTTAQTGFLSIVSQLNAQDPREIYLYKTSDGGQSWSPQGIPITGTTSSFPFGLDTTHLILTDQRAITSYAFTNGSWQKQNTLLTGARPIVFFSEQGQLGWIYVSQQSDSSITDTFYVTSDGGKSWRKVSQLIRPVPPPSQQQG